MGVIDSPSDTMDPTKTSGHPGTASQTIGEVEHRPSNTSSTENPAESHEKQYPSGVRFWLIILSLLCVVILGGLDFSIIGVAVPAMTEEYSTITDIGWYNVSYRITACATQFAWGKLFTVFPLKHSFLVAIIIFLVGSAVSATAKESVIFILGRSVTGVGSAGILTGLFATLAVVTPLRVRPIYTGVISGCEAVAIVAAPILGGVLTQNASWRWCFYINLPIGGAVMVALALSLPAFEKRGNKEINWAKLSYQLDLFGILTFLVFVVCLFMALSWTGIRFFWSQWQIVVLLVVAGFCLLAFCYDQVKMGDSAAVPPRLLKQRSIVSATMFSFCLTGALGILQYYLPIYFQVVGGYSPASSGYMVIPFLVGFNVSLIAQGFLTTWLGYYVPHMILSAILTSVGAGLITTWTTDTNLARIIVYQGIFGCGCGLALEVPQIAAQAVLSEHDATRGISITLFAQNFGGALFIAVAQQVFGGEVLANLKSKVPGLNAGTIQNLGLVDFGHDSFDISRKEIIEGLAAAFKSTWYIAVALSCVTAICTCPMEWRSIKGTHASTPTEGLGPTDN